MKVPRTRASREPPPYAWTKHRGYRGVRAGMRRDGHVTLEFDEEFVPSGTFTDPTLEVAGVVHHTVTLEAAAKLRDVLNELLDDA